MPDHVPRLSPDPDPGTPPPPPSGDQEARHLLQSRFRILAESLPQLVWLSCDQGLWTWASPQWLDYTGQRQEESHGWGWMDAVHPDDRAKAHEAWHEARAHGLLDVEYRVRCIGEGAWRLHHTYSYPVRALPTRDDPEGRIVEWVGTCTDAEVFKHLRGG